MDTKHFLIVVGLYAFVAAVNALPNPPTKFEFYPWFVHVCKSLLNVVPAKYNQNPTPPTEETK